MNPTYVTYLQTIKRNLTEAENSFTMGEGKQALQRATRQIVNALEGLIETIENQGREIEYLKIQLTTQQQSITWLETQFGDGEDQETMDDINKEVH